MFLPATCVEKLIFPGYPFFEAILKIDPTHASPWLVSVEMMSRISLSFCRSLALRQRPRAGSWYSLGVRVLSTSGGGSGDKEKTITNRKGDLSQDTAADDIFGVNYEDGDDRMGPESAYPPMYKRDATTGHLTGDVENEMTEDDRRILSASPSEQEDMLLEHLDEHWKQQGDNWASEMGRRVREADMGLNVLGRSPNAQATNELSEDDMMKGDREKAKSHRTGFSHRLTRDEFEGFREYMRKRRSKVSFSWQKFSQTVDD